MNKITCYCFVKANYIGKITLEEKEVVEYIQDIIDTNGSIVLRTCGCFIECSNDTYFLLFDSSRKPCGLYISGKLTSKGR